MVSLRNGLANLFNNTQLYLNLALAFRELNRLCFMLHLCYGLNDLGNVSASKLWFGKKKELKAHSNIRPNYINNFCSYFFKIRYSLSLSLSFIMVFQANKNRIRYQYIDIFVYTIINFVACKLPNKNYDDDDEKLKSKFQNWFLL